MSKSRTEIIGKGTPLWKTLLLEYRLPWRYYDKVRGIKFKFSAKKIIKTPPFPLDTDSDVEIHMLLNKNYIYMGLFTLKSFLRFYNKINVTIHGDGSLNSKSKKILEKHIPGIRIINLKDANKLMQGIDPLLTHVKKNVSTYFYTHPITTIKWTDFALLSKCDRMILLDSDTLFFKKPKEIIDWIEKKPISNYNLYTESRKDNLGWDDKFLKKKFKNIKIIRKINSGLVCIKRKEILDNLKFICEEITNNPEFREGINSGDQDIYRIILGVNKSKPLSFKDYPVIGVASKSFFNQYKNAIFKHYLIKFEGGFYKEDMDSILRDYN